MHQCSQTDWYPAAAAAAVAVVVVAAAAAVVVVVGVGRRHQSRSLQAVGKFG